MEASFNGGFNNPWTTEHVYSLCTIYNRCKKSTKKVNSFSNTQLSLTSTRWYWLKPWIFFTFFFFFFFYFFYFILLLLFSFFLLFSFCYSLFHFHHDPGSKGRTNDKDQAWFIRNVNSSIKQVKCIISLSLMFVVCGYVDLCCVRTSRDNAKKVQTSPTDLTGILRWKFNTTRLSLH